MVCAASPLIFREALCLGRKSSVTGRTGELRGGLVMRDSGPEGTSGIPLCSYNESSVSRQFPAGGVVGRLLTCPAGSAVMETLDCLRDSRSHVATSQDTDLSMAAEGDRLLIRVITTITHEITLHCE
jgi:hypothetical protein